MSQTGYIGHLDIGVPDLAIASHDAEILHEPREFPESGQHFATYRLDLHGIKVEVVSGVAEG